MSNPINKSIALFLAGIVLVVVPVAGNQRVLCYGTDGHVAVESSHFECPSDHRAEQVTIGASPSIATAATCIDVPLNSGASGAAIIAKQRPDQVERITLGAVVVSEHHWQTLAVSFAFGLSAPPPPPGTELLRSIILQV